MSKTILEMKGDIDYIVQSLSEVDGFLKGLRLMADSDQSNDLYKMGVKISGSMGKAIDMWQTYSLEDYQGLEATLKALEETK